MKDTRPSRPFKEISQTRGFKLSVVVILFALLLGFVYVLRHIFNPFLMGILMAYILEPLIHGLVKRGLSRRLSIILTYTIMLVGSAIVVSISSVALTRQVEELVLSIPDDQYIDANGNGVWEPGERLTQDYNDNQKYDLGYRGRLRGQLVNFVKWWNSHLPFLSINKVQFQQGLKESLDSILVSDFEENPWRSYWQIGLQSAGGLGLVLLYLVMVPLYAFFIQNLVPIMRQALPALIPEAVRDQSVRLYRKLDLELSAFFRGKIIVCLLKGLLTYIGLELCGVRFAFFIGFLAGALSIIPYLGALVGFFLAGLIQLLDTGTFSALIGIVIVFVLMEVIEFFLNLIVFGREVGIHPLAFILALFVGGELFGLFGLIMAVPLVSVITILYKEFVAPILNELARPVSVKESPDEGVS